MRIEPFEVRWLESGVLMSCGPGADLRATPAAVLMECQRRAPSPCQSGSVLKIILKITSESEDNSQKPRTPIPYSLRRYLLKILENVGENRDLTSESLLTASPHHQPSCQPSPPALTASPHHQPSPPSLAAILAAAALATTSLAVEGCVTPLRLLLV